MLERPRAQDGWQEGSWFLRVGRWELDIACANAWFKPIAVDPIGALSDAESRAGAPRLISC